MLDSVSYFVVVRYRYSRLTVRRRFSSWRDAHLFVLKTVANNSDYNAIMPLEVKIQIIPELPD